MTFRAHSIESEVRAKLRDGRMVGVAFRSVFRPVGSTRAVVEIMGRRFTVDDSSRLSRQAGMVQVGGRGSSQIRGTQRDIAAFFDAHPRLGPEDFGVDRL
jgi:hypothetical protein